MLMMAAVSVTGFVAYDKMNSSELLNANVEALAGGEIIVHPICYDYNRICYILDDDLGYNEIRGVRAY